MKKMYTYLSLLTILFSLEINAQRVKTIRDIGASPDDGMAIDSKGNLFVSNYEGGKVYRAKKRKIELISEGVIQTPNGMAVDNYDNLYVSDLEGNKIYKITPGGSIEVFVDSINYPTGIIQSPFGDDTLYFAQYEGKINKLSLDGKVIPFAESDSISDLSSVIGICADENFNIYAGGFWTGKIHKIKPDGSVSPYADIPLGGDIFPSLGYIDYSNGNIYGTSIGLHKIYKVDQNKVVTQFAGTDQGKKDCPLFIAQFDQPNGILASSTGDTIFVTDFNTKNIRMIIGVNRCNPNHRVSSLTQLPVNPISYNLENKNLNLQFNLETTSTIKVSLYNTQGKKIKTLIDKNMPEGFYKNQFQLENYPQGIYLLEWIDVKNNGRRFHKIFLD